MEQDVHNIRSRILNYAIVTEWTMSDFIKQYFIRDINKAEEFNNSILNKEFFTFEQKIRVFSAIIKKSNNIEMNDIEGNRIVFPEYRKKLINKITYIREIRNLLAHKHPFTKKSGEPYIQYMENNKSCELMLDSKFDKLFFKKYCDILHILKELIKRNV